MSGRPYFPLYLDMSDKDILFVGGGKIAARRIGVLEPFAERITVVAPEAEGSILELTEAGKANWIMRAFEEEDLEGRDIVFAATDDRELNAGIAEMCRRRGILVNVSSDRELCDFYFPGIVRQGETVIGVNASGQDHAKARRVRERIQEILTEEGI
ncbi:MAG: precorrin-2 dehydrogenase/sirohydrochlorin ferrochelatase family protein [Bacillota bacterium]